MSGDYYTTTVIGDEADGYSGYTKGRFCSLVDREEIKERRMVDVMGAIIDQWAVALGCGAGRDHRTPHQQKDDGFQRPRVKSHVSFLQKEREIMTRDPVMTPPAPVMTPGHTELPEQWWNQSNQMTPTNRDITPHRGSRAHKLKKEGIEFVAHGVSQSDPNDKEWLSGRSANATNVRLKSTELPPSAMRQPTPERKHGKSARSSSTASKSRSPERPGEL